MDDKYRPTSRGWLMAWMIIAIAGGVGGLVVVVIAATVFALGRALAWW